MARKPPHRRKSKPRTRRCGRGRPWRRLRELFFNSSQVARLCAECLKEERVSLATQVDHIVPAEDDPRKFWDIDNLQGLCDAHHEAKTREENRAR